MQFKLIDYIELLLPKTLYYILDLKIMKHIPFYIVDVFAEEAYQGNQLSVFLETEGLSVEMMQQMAQETNFAESTFILSNEEKNGGFDVRIFTPAFEVPFAGHPTLGSAYVIQEFILKEKVNRIHLNLGVGQIPVDFYYQDEQLIHLWMKQINPTFGANFPNEEVASIFGLTSADIDIDFPIQQVSTGIPFIIVPLANMEVMEAIQADQNQFYDFIDSHRDEMMKDGEQVFAGFFLFCPHSRRPENDIHARMFFSELGIREDSATGSANGCLLSYLLKHNFFQLDELNLRVEQGYEMGRPSLIQIQGKKIDEENYEIKVGGQVQTIASGTWLAAQ